MCSLGRHQLEDDIPAPKIRRPAGARTVSRQQLREAQARMKRQLEEETHRLDPGQAVAQEQFALQFALQFEAVPPGVDQVALGGEGVPDSEIPFWARMP